MSIQRGTVFWEAIVAEWLATQSAMRGQMAEARQQWGRSVNADASRDLAGQYLFRTSRRSMIETMVRLDPSVGRKIMDDAIARYPLKDLSPLDRPYGHMAMAYAVAGELDHARELLSEYEATPDADHSEDAELYREGARGVIALSENRFDDALEAFWRFDDGNECPTCSYAWLARTFEARGDLDTAMVLMEKVVSMPSAEIWYDAAHLGYGYRCLGEYYEARGDTEKAIEHYSNFVNLRDVADPEFQGEVELVKEALLRLSGDRPAQC